MSIEDKPKGYAGLLWEYEFLLYLSVYVFSLTAVIIYTGLLIHIDVIPLAAYSSESISKMVSNNSNWKFYGMTGVWATLGLVSYKYYRDTKPES